MKKKGFTLIELMVTVSLMIILVGGGVIYLNNFNIRQKLDKAQAEVASTIKLAANFAKVKQSPLGNSDEVNYVRLRVNGLNVEADINGVGTTYFSKNILESGLTVTFNPAILYFWGGSGQLSNDVNGSFYGATQKADVRISINQGIAETRVIFINSLGGVN